MAFNSPDSSLIVRFELHFPNRKTAERVELRKVKQTQTDFNEPYAMGLIPTHTSGASHLIYTNTRTFGRINCILSVFSYRSCIYFMYIVYGSECIRCRISGNESSCSDNTNSSNLVVRITKICLLSSLQPNHSHSGGFRFFFSNFLLLFWTIFSACFSFCSPHRPHA